LNEGFWDELSGMLKEIDMDELESWLVRLYVHLEKHEKRILKRKKKKIRKLVNERKFLKISKILCT